VDKEAVQLWRERSERYRRSAAHYRTLIERGERSADYGYPNWPATRAMLIKIAEGFEHGSRAAENALDP
jgi:hypothetical protein